MQNQQFEAFILCTQRDWLVCAFPATLARDRWLRAMFLCKVDISVAGRGLPNLWKGAEHTRQERKFRIMTQHTLLDKSCCPLSAEEDWRICLQAMVEPPVYLSSPLGLSVYERMALKEAVAVSAEARPSLSTESATYKWLSQFLSSFAVVTDFRSLMQVIDQWVVCMQNEPQFVERPLTYAKYLTFAKKVS